MVNSKENYKFDPGVKGLNKQLPQHLHFCLPLVVS